MWIGLKLLSSSCAVNTLAYKSWEAAYSWARLLDHIHSSNGGAVPFKISKFHGTFSCFSLSAWGSVRLGLLRLGFRARPEEWLSYSRKRRTIRDMKFFDC